MITEIAIFQLNSSTNLSDPNSPAGKVIRDLLIPENIANGANHVFYGQFIEKPGTAIMFVHWNSYDDRQRFVNSSTYANHAEIFRSIAKPEAQISILHVPFVPEEDVFPALGANANREVGATEVVFFYFSSALTRDQRAIIMSDHVGKMRPVMDRPEALAVYDGWALEESVQNPLSETKDETCQVFVNVVGWVDVDAHLRFQSSEDFGANIYYLLGIKELLHTELFHVRLLTV